MYLKKLERSKTTFEYGINTQRNFPWEGVITPPFGNSWAIVGSGGQTEANAHHEAEVFIVFQGEGLMRVGDEEEIVRPHDIVYVPPFVEHTVKNTGEGEFIMLSTWWDPAEVSIKSAKEEEQL